MREEAKGGFARSKGSEQDAVEYVDKRFRRSLRMEKLHQVEFMFVRAALKAAGEVHQLLDIPCGSGRFAECFANIPQVFAMDYNENMLSALVQTSPSAKNFARCRADLRAIPLEDKSVDIAFCMRLFHHISKDEDRERGLRELARVSRRHVALTFYCSDTWRYWKRMVRQKKTSGYSISHRGMLDLAKRAGLRPVRSVQWRSMIEQQRCLLFEKETA